MAQASIKNREKRATFIIYIFFEIVHFRPECAASALSTTPYTDNFSNRQPFTLFVLYDNPLGNNTKLIKFEQGTLFLESKYLMP